MSEYIVFDTEYTSWSDSIKTNWVGENEYKEIVQIGGLKISDGKIIDQLNIYIKPVKNPKLSNYFTRLTGITQQKIDKYGLDFELAMKNLYAFTIGIDNVYSWGNDWTVIKENIDLHVTKNPNTEKFYEQDFKRKFKNMIPLVKSKTDINIDDYPSGALYKAFGLTTHHNLRLHNAFHDSYSLYLVGKHLNL